MADTLFAAGTAVLTAGSVDNKPDAALRMKALSEAGAPLGDIPVTLPDAPARPNKPDMVPPGDVPRRRLGSVQGRAALLHAVAHIEFNAIDLATDMFCRFAGDPVFTDKERPEFVRDWIKVAGDEGRHFKMVRARLNDLGYDYGDFPAHNGLWEAAVATKDIFAGRLAIAPMVLEARGLDVTPAMIAKFDKVGDTESADILRVIYTDEITHVATGMKWFNFLAEKTGQPPEAYFKTLVRTYFKGLLKPPFNEPARTEAGLPKGFYTGNCSLS